jgi:hypothetical protein
MLAAEQGMISMKRTLLGGMVDAGGYGTPPPTVANTAGGATNTFKILRH